MNDKVIYGVGRTVGGALSKLETEVKKHIKEGYLPKCGIAISKADSGWITACQTVVKKW